MAALTYRQVLGLSVFLKDYVEGKGGVATVKEAAAYFGVSPDNIVAAAGILMLPIEERQGGKIILVHTTNRGHA